MNSSTIRYTLAPICSWTSHQHGALAHSLREANLHPSLHKHLSSASSSPLPLQTTVRLALLQHDALCASLASAIDHLPPNQLVHLLRAFPSARHTELVARPFRSPKIALSSRMPPYCRHGCKLMAVPRGFSRGFLAAETGRPLPLFSRPLKKTRCAIAKGQHAALHDAERDTRCARSLTA